MGKKGAWRRGKRGRAEREKRQKDRDMFVEAALKAERDIEDGCISHFSLKSHTVDFNQAGRHNTDGQMKRKKRRHGEGRTSSRNSM